MIVAPSILSANFSNLLKEVKDVEKCGAAFLHIDVMDGHFVPNITMGPVIYKDLREKTDIIFDVHLMIDDPSKYAEAFINAGADVLTFHYEAAENPKKIISYIKSFGIKAGISIKPNTDVKVLDDLLSDVDLVLIMSVEPGFGGQKFIDTALDKIKYLSNLKTEKGYDYLIEVDGGINYETASLCAEAGCDVVVAGTYIFTNTDRNKIIKDLIKL